MNEIKIKPKKKNYCISFTACHYYAALGSVVDTNTLISHINKYIFTFLC